MNTKKYNYVIPMKFVSLDDLAIVGGKATELRRLQKHGFAIPVSYCITTDVFHYYCTHSRKLSSVIKKSIVGVRKLIQSKELVVRSSAIEETIDNITSAGKYISTLHIKNDKELLRAVERTYNAYIHSESGGNKDIGASKLKGMALIIQELIPVTYAGVGSSANPITGKTDEIVIELVENYGDKLMSGAINGALYYIDKKTGECNKVKLQKNVRKINNNILKDISKLVKDIELLYESPQDVEIGVIEKGSRHKLVVFQTRNSAVNTNQDNTGKVNQYLDSQIEKINRAVKAAIKNRHVTQEDIIFSSSNLSEILPFPTYMSFKVFEYIFGMDGAIYRGRKKIGYALKPIPSSLYSVFFGNVYFNLEIDAKTFYVGFPLDISSYIEKIKEDNEYGLYPEIGLYEQCLTWKTALSRFGVVMGPYYYIRYKIFQLLITYHLRRYESIYRNRMEKKFLQKIDAFTKKNIKNYSIEDIKRDFFQILSFLKEELCVEYVIAARLGFFATERLHNILSRIFPKSTDRVLSSLLSVHSETEYSRFGKDIQHMKTGDISKEEFIKKYGHFALNELELSIPRLGEMNSINDFIFKESEYNSYKSSKNKTRRYNTFVLRRIKRSDEDNDQFMSSLRQARMYLTLREDIKFHFTRLYKQLRKLLVLSENKLRLNEGDIFFLSTKEFNNFSAKTRKILIKKIKRRKQQYQLARQYARHFSIPRIIVSSRLKELKKDVIIQSKKIYKCIPVSSGIVSGKVRIINSKNISNMLDNITPEDIIVAQSANLGIDPILRKASGAIFSLGGTLSHGACRARDIGKPAVVLHNAYFILKEGEKITIDGNKGKVYIQ